MFILMNYLTNLIQITLLFHLYKAYKTKFCSWKLKISAIPRNFRSQWPRDHAFSHVWRWGSVSARWTPSQTDPSSVLVISFLDWNLLVQQVVPYPSTSLLEVELDFLVWVMCKQIMQWGQSSNIATSFMYSNILVHSGVFSRFFLVLHNFLLRTIS